ncbi:hypothetical protein DSO57_1001148 [Entomophthora muscae]|uniref:Uncharacterized protein n=1 Tax=Entomophthora muscae TaxID=34485 RepID=A0ACC2S005_9FUNG|nr:hypothetical protein DSO57_1001148 [Entomophthora muscae]
MDNRTPITATADMNPQNNAIPLPGPPNVFDNTHNPAPLVNETRQIQASFDYMLEMSGDVFNYAKELKASSGNIEPEQEKVMNSGLSTRLNALQKEIIHFENLVLQSYLVLLNARRGLEALYESKAPQHLEPEGNMTNPTNRSPLPNPGQRQL